MARKNKAILNIIKHKYLLALIFGMSVGTFFANFMGASNVDVWGVFNQEYLEMMSVVDFDTKHLFQYVMKSRLKMVFFIILCGLTKIAIPCLFIMLLFGGFFIGIMVSFSTMQYGVLGLLLSVASVLPQWIFYAFSVFIFSQVLYEVKVKQKAPACILALACMMVGIVMEVYVNPVLVKNVIYLIY